MYKSRSNCDFQQLISQPLRYGIKSPDCELYDIGFGEWVNYTDHSSKTREVCNYTIHITCRFKIIKKKGDQSTRCYFEDTPSSIFQSDIQNLIGLQVKRVTLSDKNDLWIDLDDYWIVIATFEDDLESWCFLTYDTANLYLSVSYSDMTKIEGPEDQGKKTGDCSLS